MNALVLKIIAMPLMLCDHMWSTVLPGFPRLTTIGRISFPIFAFQIAEGFDKTHDRKKYLKRVFIFALISELPFNLMVGGGWFYPFHQNVMFTFCLAILAMMLLEAAKKKGKLLFVLTFVVLLPVSYILGFITFVDYYGYGIWMVLLFYLFKDMRWGWIGELAGMIYINWVMIGGLVFIVPILGHTAEIPEQGLAVLALIPIWLYNGKQGPHSKAIQYAYYAFYPVHMLVLAIIALYIL